MVNHNISGIIIIPFISANNKECRRCNRSNGNKLLDYIAGISIDNDYSHTLAKEVSCRIIPIKNIIPLTGVNCIIKHDTHSTILS